MRFLACFLMIVLLASPAAAAEKVDDKEREEYLELYGLLAEAVAQVELNYAEPVDRRKLFESALNGMLRDLDPYSRYLGPDEFGAYQKQLRGGSEQNLGLELAIRDGRVVVLGVAPNSPASEVGISPGDVVKSIAGQKLENLSLTVTEEKIARLAKSGVDLELVGDDDKPRTVKLTSRSFTPSTVIGASQNENGRWQYLLPQSAQRPQRLGYVRVTSFGDQTATDLRTALFEAKENGAEGVVLDLRFNAGGLLTAAVDVADLFLNEGMIVATEGRNTKRREWKATKDATLPRLPLVVLVNRYSASASEVVAAAVQDNGRAKIVGERTWGKGSVQNIIELAVGNSGIKLTTASYQRPSGDNIHRFPSAQETDVWGVSPDEGLALALKAEEARALLKQFGSNSAATSLSADQQLELAVQQLTKALQAKQ